MEINKKESQIVLLSLSCLFLFFSVLAWLSDTCYEGGDNYIHYQIAKYSWRYPSLFLHHWGKPFYTLLISPFAQFGFKAAKIFNVLVGILAAYFTFLTARELRYKHSFLTIFFVLFAPIYFVMLNSVFTEILFSFMLILATYYLVKKKFLTAAILISFIPLVRSEGIIFFPVYFLYLLLNRQYKYIPVLTTGFIIYGLIGYFYFGDFLWLINQNPYNGAYSLYGKGSLFNFINEYDKVYGRYFYFSILAGIVLFGYKISTTFKQQRERITDEFFLIFCPAIGFFLFHSILWWRGWGSSLGEVRVISSIVPLLALIALPPLNFVTEKITEYRFFRSILLGLVIYMVITSPFRIYHLPYANDPPQQLVKEACDWLKGSPYATNKVYYYDPVVLHFLDRDPYTKKEIQELLPDRDKPEMGLLKGEIVFWDAHFSPNEGGVPLSNLSENPNFILLKKFSPAEPFKVLGGYNYELYLFQKI
jgi:hypothetical protein